MVFRRERVAAYCCLAIVLPFTISRSTVFVSWMLPHRGGCEVERCVVTAALSVSQDGRILAASCFRQSLFIRFRVAWQGGRSHSLSALLGMTWRPSSAHLVLSCEAHPSGAFCQHACGTLPLSELRVRCDFEHNAQWEHSGYCLRCPSRTNVGFCRRSLICV